MQSDLRVTAERYSPPPLRQMVTVSIQLIADTHSIPLRPGQGLYIASSLHGSWNPDEAVMLTVDPLEKGEGVIPTHYVWRHVLTVPKFLGMFEYKYIVRSLEYDIHSSNPHKSLCRWESGAKRVVDLKSVKEDILLKNDSAVHFEPAVAGQPEQSGQPGQPEHSGQPLAVASTGPDTAHGGLTSTVGGLVGSMVNDGTTNAIDSSNVALSHPNDDLSMASMASMTEFNLSMDFLEGDDDLPPPMVPTSIDGNNTALHPPSPGGLSFLRPAPSPHDPNGNGVGLGGSPNRFDSSSITWGNDTSGTRDGVGSGVMPVVMPFDTEDDADFQQQLLENAAEKLLNA